MFDVIIDLLFFGAILIAALPILLGLYGVIVTLKILFGMFFKGITYSCGCPQSWVILHRHRKK